MKKILVIVGSGRKNGNTEQLADAFILGAKEAGHFVKKVSLSTKFINGCTGCGVCRTEKQCIQNDDFNDIVPYIKTCDLLVFVSPLMYYQVSSRMKAFWERFYSCSEDAAMPEGGRIEIFPEKDCALLLNAEENEFWCFEQAVSYYHMAVVQYMGFHDKGMLLAGGCGDRAGQPEIKETEFLMKAYEFGKNIYKENAYENEKSIINK